MIAMDLLLLDLLGTLLPAFSLLLCALLAVSTVKNLQAQRDFAAAKQQPSIYDQEPADGVPVNAVMEVVRTGRGRVSTAMRSTHHTHTADHCAAA